MKFLKNKLLSFILPVLFLLFWQVFAMKINNSAILPTIPEVLKVLIHPTKKLIGTGSLLSNIGISLLRVFIAFHLAIFLGVFLGLLIGMSSFFEKFLFPFLNLFRPIPPLAWSPLVLAWFGVISVSSILGIKNTSPHYILLNHLRISMIFIIFMSAFYPILINTISGVKGVNQNYIDGAKVHGASNFQIFYKILLPGALPSLLTGLRVGLSTSWIALVCSEMLPGSVIGVGYLITHAYQLTRIDIVMAGIISIALINYSMDHIFRLIEQKFLPWISKEK